MREAPQWIVARQRRYARGARVWFWLPVVANISYLAMYCVALLKREGLHSSVRTMAGVAIALLLIGLALLKPKQRATRYRKAAVTLYAKMVRYEVGESVSLRELEDAAREPSRSPAAG